MTMTDHPKAAASPIDAGLHTDEGSPAQGSGLRSRPGPGRTFAGRAPEQVAVAARSAETPTRCPARISAWRAGVMIAEGFPVARISDHLDDGTTVVWLDLGDPDTADLDVLTEEFGLHPLAVEDAVHEHQRPKLDRYDDHLFLSAYAVHLDEATGTVATSELAAFITPRALITVRKDDGFDVGALLQRLGLQPRFGRWRRGVPSARPARPGRRRPLRRGPVPRRPDREPACRWCRRSLLSARRALLAGVVLLEPAHRRQRVGAQPLQGGVSPRSRTRVSNSAHTANPDTEPASWPDPADRPPRR